MSVSVPVSVSVYFTHSCCSRSLALLLSPSLTPSLSRSLSPSLSLSISRLLRPRSCFRALSYSLLRARSFSRSPALSHFMYISSISSGEESKYRAFWILTEQRAFWQNLEIEHRAFRFNIELFEENARRFDRTQDSFHKTYLGSFDPVYPDFDFCYIQYVGKILQHLHGAGAQALVRRKYRRWIWFSRLVAATHCNTLQRTATRWNAQKHIFFDNTEPTRFGVARYRFKGPFLNL